jgi:hypothetical protein
VELDADHDLSWFPQDVDTVPEDVDAVPGNVPADEPAGADRPSERVTLDTGDASFADDG